MTTDLTDKERAEKMRQIADLMDEVGTPLGGAGWRATADKIDPPDPLAGLDDDQWVEVIDADWTPLVGKVRELTRAQIVSPLRIVRVIPEGDARDVLVIPVEDAREALKPGQDAWNLLNKALDKHETRWSK